MGRNVIRALRQLRISTPASLSASCYDTAISVKGSSRRAVHLSGSLEAHVRLQKILGPLRFIRRLPTCAAACIFLRPMAGIE
ncbi:high-affinity iron permease 1 [Paraburkholderia caribensis MBA4]|uniref:High-affinity iron permease 1 n=1 Tax=Paraburkholderia caribensis MBA4 TaxID=1323664 RepID=A0A0P0RE72_9BURK|nr:high-affinity iron permease 1 [Paraburkholderia caribensis MBA4]